jgi:hypothetical protein
MPEKAQTVFHREDQTSERNPVLQTQIEYQFVGFLSSVSSPKGKSFSLVRPGFRELKSNIFT